MNTELSGDAAMAAALARLAIRTKPRKIVGHGSDQPRAEAMWALYDIDGKSLQQVATAFNCSRQSVWSMFAGRGWAMRPVRPASKSIIEYGGLKYAPDRGGYYRRTTNRTGNYFLHRVLWVAAHGPIPKGHDVGFKDNNPAHVCIDNLECLTTAEMTRKRNPRKLVAHDPCMICGAEMVPHLRPAGTWETPAAFKKRLSCGAQCGVAIRRRNGFNERKRKD